MTDELNSAKGRTSFDITVGDSLVHFFNRNVTPYPTEVGAPSFDLIPIEKQKDIMVNVAKLHAEQEYNRIMELVSVLQNQAASIKRRLELTDIVHSAKYNFQVHHGHIYWLLFDTKENISRLSMTGPDEWSSSPPEHYSYITKIKWLGDHTWIEVE